MSDPSLMWASGAVGWLVIAGTILRFSGMEDDDSAYLLAMSWPIWLPLLVGAGLFIGLPILIVGTIAGRIDPLEPIRNRRREYQLRRARRIAEDEAELKRLLEL